MTHVIYSKWLKYLFKDAEQKKQYAKTSITNKQSIILDAADDDLTQWVDQRLQNFTGVNGAQHPTPQIQTVHILPVIHGLICLLRMHKTEKHGSKNILDVFLSDRVYTKEEKYM